MKRVVCIQPVLTQHDYQSAEHFYIALRRYLVEIQSNGWLSPQTVVCFPEYIGTWLVFANAPSFVLRAKSFRQALMRLAAGSCFKIFPHFIRSHAPSRLSEALFKARSQTMLEIYQTTFSKLASEFRVTIVGGSIVLPAPSIEDNRLCINKQGLLRNIACVWDTAGKLQHLIAKMSPTEPELKFTSGGALEELKAVDTPAGRLAIIICGDGWEQKTYDHYAKQNVDAFIILAFVPSDVDWNGPWKGYSGKQPEVDVDTNDVGSISEYEAWKKYCLLRAKNHGKPSVVFYNRTQLWDFGSHGHPLILDENTKSYETVDNGDADYENIVSSGAERRILSLKKLPALPSVIFTLKLL